MEVKSPYIREFVGGGGGGGGGLNCEAKAQVLVVTPSPLFFLEGRKKGGFTAGQYGMYKIIVSTYRVEVYVQVLGGECSHIRRNVHSCTNILFIVLTWFASHGQLDKEIAVYIARNEKGEYKRGVPGNNAWRKYYGARALAVGISLL